MRGILDAENTMSRKIATDNTSITEVAYLEGGSMQGWNIMRVREDENVVLGRRCKQ